MNEIIKGNIITKVYRLGLTICEKNDYKHEFIITAIQNSTNEFHYIFNEQLAPDWQITLINNFLKKLHNGIKFSKYDINDMEHIYEKNYT